MLAEETRPEDGSVLRKWSWARFDADTQLQHTKDRYEVVVDGKIIRLEEHERSPSVRWYSQAEALDLYREAGFTDLQVFKGFTHEPAAEQEDFFSIIGHVL
jgi:hypothetical protein